ncbi:hypothetical protein SeLEV6574_g02163 [Synchytrium endobioticum]|nr:hypothetical protein SeLEV6574_g02163 [Synchytrium endobioticum]
MLSACAGAVLTSLLVTPFDVVKTRMQVGSDVIMKNAASQSPTSSSRVPNVCCRFYYMEMDTGVCRMYPATECPTALGQRSGLGVPRAVATDAAGIPQKYTGTLDGIVKIIRHEGLPQLWRGLSPTLVMSVPSTVIYYVGYEKVRDKMAPLFRRKGVDGYTPLFAGAIARTCAATIISPLELVRTRMQSGGSDKPIGAVVVGVLDTVRKQGMMSMWRGLAPTLWRDIPFSAIYWVGYESIKKRLPRPTEASELMKEFSLSFTAGAISGTVAATLTTPFDVAKTVRQVSRDTIQHGSDGRTLNLLKTIIEQDGYRGLLRGLSPRIAKVAPACAIMISSYELGKIFFTAGFDKSAASRHLRHDTC